GSKNSGFNKNDFADKYDGSFTPVIDFPNFLMHVLRIYLEMTDKCGDFTKTVPLDEKYLLNSFEEKIKEDESVRNFIYVLLICRYLFDCYVIKSNAIRTGEENWSLWAVRPNGSSYYYKNTFGNNTESKNDEKLDNSDDTKIVVMLLSMFHVSNPSRIYKNWLYAVLRWLFDNKDDIKQSDYIKFLEELCDKFYFGNNCQGEDITDIILGKEIDFSSNKEWNDGVFVPNFVFNRLDYQLWEKYKNTYPQFRFTFRSSVEHHYPQHPSEEHGLEKLDKETLDNFGNLYLLSQSKNSRLSNLPPEAKLTYYPNGDYDSLKQALMMEKTKELNNWKNEEILKHGKEMLKILNQPLSKANS
ncbi:HNH endonuclease family protein, partial [uncultured Haemophilus sp.]|uniref:HNH endonuclease family protein n=1 Tax=uncultured Haemophilus sp. TaxID=237779 RepID=UPI00262CC991